MLQTLHQALVHALFQHRVGGGLAPAHLLRRLHHRRARADQLPRPEEPLLADILVDRVAGDGLEAVHEIVPAEIKPPGQGADRQVRVQVPGDVAQDLLDLGVHPIAVRLLLGRAVLEDVPVHVDQKLLAEGVRQAGGAELRGALGLLQPLDGPHVLEAPLGVRPQQVEAPAPGGVKAGVQSLAGVAPGGQPVPAQPDHHPLIGLRGVDDRPVDQAPGHQKDVPGLEEVGDALHQVGHLPPQEEDELVELVIVVLQLLGAAVLEVEEAEVLVQIAPFFGALAGGHGVPPLSRLCPLS